MLSESNRPMVDEHVLWLSILSSVNLATEQHNGVRERATWWCAWFDCETWENVTSQMFWVDSVYSIICFHMIRVHSCIYFESALMIKKMCVLELLKLLSTLQSIINWPLRLWVQSMTKTSESQWHMAQKGYCSGSKDAMQRSGTYLVSKHISYLVVVFKKTSTHNYWPKSF